MKNKLVMKNKRFGWVWQGAVLAAFAFAGGFAAQTFLARSGESRSLLDCQAVAADQFAQTELFFGLSKSDGTVVSDREFQRFVDREVTPRFPSGLTVLTAEGQFQNSKGTLIKERSRLLVLLYPVAEQRQSHLKVEQIRQAYTTTFAQESVLRSDDRSCVSF